MTTLRWRRSTRSGGNGECVEAASIQHAVLMRDSKTSTGDSYPVLSTSPSNWASLIANLRDTR